jgi:hypothetical protein
MMCRRALSVGSSHHIPSVVVAALGKNAIVNDVLGPDATRKVCIIHLTFAYVRMYTLHMRMRVCDTAPLVLRASCTKVSDTPNMRVFTNMHNNITH